MDIKTVATIITCIYDDLFGTEFGGRPHPTRKYYFGIESLTKLEAPIIIYTWPKNVEHVIEYYSNFLGKERFEKQIKVFEFDLYKSPLYEIIKTIKKPEHGLKNDRSYDLMIAKYLMAKDAISTNPFSSNYFFWMDAGLSNSALFPDKYLEQSDPEKRYSDCLLFTPKVTDQLIANCNNNLLLFRLNAVGHWFDPRHIKMEENENPWYIIGGIFGGNPIIFSKFCDDVINLFINHIENNKILYLDEQLMTMIISYERNRSEFINFGTWYHENSGEWTNSQRQNKKAFYSIFEDFNYEK